MKEKLEQLLAEGRQRIESVVSETELQDVKVRCWASRAA